MRDGIALSPVDELLCAMRGVPETIGAAALFVGEPPRVDEVRDRVVERWGGLPRLCRVLARPKESAWPRPHRWLPLERFDPGRQVVPTGDAGEHTSGEAEFADLLDRLVAHPLPDGLPPWRLRLVRRAGEGRFALVLTAHHALLDGRSLELLLSRLLDGGLGRGGRTGGGVRAVRALRAAHPDHARPSARPRVPLGSGRALPLPEGAPPRPELAWTEVDADAVRAARRALPGLGATLNEVLLAAATGALRAVHGAPERWPGAPRPLYGVFPVDLRAPEDEGTLGNVVSVVRVPLPVDSGDPAERLAACRGLLADHGPLRGADPTARVVDAAARLGPWALRLLAARAGAPGQAPVACMAFRWPRGSWALGGRPLERVIPLPPVQAPGTVGFALTDCAGTYTLSVVGHTLPGRVRSLADAFGRELAAHARPVREALSGPTR
ncbi:wax ester/triacylglycerol synthase domain-containing protein [Streptomyces megasporus]|uniref:wax ester/triacylglycerol synthase domain-containing protein n=1 Tax=Streptomyces megasporus TaxID=44060 RepID=UPI0014701F1A|nr:wax ester/triacylglycerol synthase domain-containing protein [Streptomyces megasporus]